MSDSVEQLFKALQQDYYGAWFRFHPERAVEVGINDHAGELRRYADDDKVGFRYFLRVTGEGEVWIIVALP